MATLESRGRSGKMRASVRPLVTICAVVMFLLLPVQFVYLPLRMSAADVWVVATLPLYWMALVSLRQPVRLPYLGAMLFLLAATTLASLVSADPVGGLAVALKEVYLYTWMVTMAGVFTLSEPAARRRLLLAWYAAAAVNGALILAQFVHPPLLQQMNSAVGALGGTLDPYRPSGLMANTNAAATFQLIGFVPLVALRLPARTLVPLGLFEVASIVGTGSMGAMLALVCGLAFALALLAVYARDLSSASSLVLRSSIVAALGAAAFLAFTSEASDIEARLQSVFLDRGERSAHTRFGIWDKGVQMLQEELPVMGIGPGRFRDLEGDEMHNDLLSFAVERGVLGLVGLCVLGALVIGRSMRTFRADPSPDGRWRVVFPAAVVALLAESQTHEVFHVREAWLVLALQEAVLWGAPRPASAPDGREPPARAEPAP